MMGEEQSGFWGDDDPTIDPLVSGGGRNAVSPIEKNQVEKERPG